MERDPKDLWYPRRPHAPAWGRLILSPSSGGKTWYAQQHPDEFVDGDKIVKAAIGWPEKSHWWREPFSNLVHVANSAVIEMYLRQHEITVLFNGPPWTFNPALVHGVVIPPDEVLKRNADGKKVKGVTTQDVDHEPILGGARRMEEWAKTAGVTIYTRFEDIPPDWEARKEDSVDQSTEVIEKVN